MISVSEYKRHNVTKTLRCDAVWLAIESLSLSNSLVVLTTSEYFKPNIIIEKAIGDKTRRFIADGENL